METKSFDYDDIPAMLRHRADRRGLSAIDYTVDCGLDRVAADEIEKLREALRNAIRQIEFWSGYASEDERKRHELNGILRDLREMGSGGE